MNAFEIHDPWSLAALVILLAFNWYQTRQNGQIVKSTNGLVDKRVQASREAAYAQGVNDGRESEQKRIVAKDLAASKSPGTEPKVDP